MRLIKDSLKWGFNIAASRFGEHRQRSDVPKLWILMYHRVLPRTDPRYRVEEPGMLVTPESLDMQLSIIKELFTVVDLADWLRNAEAGEALPDKACAITFDDGWLDNHEHALPLLQKHQVPATLFAVADKVGTSFRFWPNIVSELVAQNAAALDKHTLFVDAAKLARNGFTRGGIAQVIDRLKAHTEAEIFAALNAINWQESLRSNEPALMSWAQIKQLHDSGLVTIGSHTATHQRLNKHLGGAALDMEIIKSRTTLEQQLQSPVNLFCFPNGDYDSAALSRVRSTYDAAVTTSRGINKADQLNRHELSRIALHEDGSNTRHKFLARLSGW